MWGEIMRLTVVRGLASAGVLVLACATRSSFAAFAGLTVEQEISLSPKSTNLITNKTDNESSDTKGGLTPTSISATATAVEPGWGGFDSADAGGAASYALIGDNHFQQTGQATSAVGLGITGSLGTWENTSGATSTETATFAVNDPERMILSFKCRGALGESDFASVVLTDLDTSQQIYSHSEVSLNFTLTFTQLLTLAPGTYQLTSSATVGNSDQSEEGNVFSHSGGTLAQFTTDLQIVPLPPALLPCTLGIGAIVVGRFLKLRRLSVANR
jgi:hypothetical protein